MATVTKVTVTKISMYVLLWPRQLGVNAAQERRGVGIPVVEAATSYLYVKCTLLPFLPTSTSTTAAWVSVPLAESLSLAEFLLYFHCTPDALTLERRR